MKTLIINGSPRKNGDTAFLLTELKKVLRGEIIEINAYDRGISPCVDCGACKTKKGCRVDDEMRIIYEDDFDNVVIASPLHMSNLTAPLMCIASRFQAYYCAKRFLRDEVSASRKKAALIIVGGGGGKPEGAVNLAKWMFKKLNAHGFENHTVLSCNTDVVPARGDVEAIEKTRDIAAFFNGGKNFVSDPIQQ